MVAALLGKKIGMTRVYTDDGSIVPVTVIQAGPCSVLQIKRVGEAKDGYNAVQMGFEDVKPHRSTLPMIGHAAKGGTAPKKFIREVRLNEEPHNISLGDVLTVEMFESSETRYVDVVSTTKGCGFTGGMKRYGFGGQPASHGTERKHRSLGSIGGNADLGTGRNIKKGKKMPGHMGNVRRTSRNHKLIRVDKENNLLLVKGSIPGPNGVYVMVRQSKTKL
ncbi:MAG: 50S ribosomal protein L3 [Planctomycetota bacterium]|nr:MAG: 50S ribosomal protein L3 [Planctomycetota bacterium]